MFSSNGAAELSRVIVRRAPDVRGFRAVQGATRTSITHNTAHFAAARYAQRRKLSAAECRYVGAS